jgi:hypothetical protein
MVATFDNSTQHNLFDVHQRFLKDDQANQQHSDTNSIQQSQTATCGYETTQRHKLMDSKPQAECSMQSSQSMTQSSARSSSRWRLQATKHVSTQVPIGSTPIDQSVLTHTHCRELDWIGKTGIEDGLHGSTSTSTMRNGIQ